MTDEQPTDIPENEGSGLEAPTDTDLDTDDEPDAEDD